MQAANKGAALGARAMTAFCTGRILRGVSQILLLAGAAGVLAGTLNAWAQVTVLHNIQVALPGVLFAQGGLCLAVAILALLGARRSPLLCGLGASIVLMQTHQAIHDIPHLVKHQIIGAQLALFPLNRLLDQFHIADVQVGDWSVPNADLLGAGLVWTMRGGWTLGAGALLGLTSDPLLAWAMACAIRARCRACGARRPLSRPARFCPSCGMETSTQQPHACPHCAREAEPSDRHCIACGTFLETSAEAPYSPQ